MEYRISYQNPHLQYIDIEVKFAAQGKEITKIYLPSWRPGRYELGNFAKNVQKLQAYNSNGKLIHSKKLTKDCWEIGGGNSEFVILKYNYYANQLNAGSTYLDEEQLYVNPVNCLVYQEGYIDVPCTLKIDVPKNYKIAIALNESGKNLFKANSYHELVDSPFIASPSIQHHSFEVAATKFHLWVQGIFKPDWEKIESDFIAYTKEQIKLFGEFPVTDYHYLFQILPYSAYHGVEHSASTVIALGPAYSILKREERYMDLLGVSSHELFHTWNVKRIRPADLWPYDYNRENYTRMGYLTEGATTWYGDLMLYRSGVFSDVEFFKTFSQLMDRHFNNPGVLNLSVADSSFDTWVDGYEAGVPNRKSSIYVEGALVTFLLDHEIRKSTQNKYSFDDLLKGLFRDAYMKDRGVTEEMYRTLAEKLASKKLTTLFNKFIYGASNMMPALKKAFNYFGLELLIEDAENLEETSIGIKLKGQQVISIYPHSIASEAGFKVGDQLMTLNGIEVKDDFSNWLEFYKEDQIFVTVYRQISGIKQLSFTNDSKRKFYRKYSIKKIDKLTAEQQENFNAWKKTT